ncbi:NAD(P)-dependent oxidoreductase [Paenibacillus paridis]|uniref:NAD(P)-dependent oxidoreductase n=1 Tax=Paenibacillus paridis TaxID=2583376 RepID=UPI001390E67F|nr:NAD(P)H-binding protein [Paenibacillus paridis]
MSLLLIGATGKTGQYIQHFIEEKGLQARRFVRMPEQVQTGSILGDIRNEQDVLQAMSGAEGVICALNTEGNGTLLTGIQHIVRSMQEFKIKRLVTIGTAGILQSELQPHLLRYQSIENKRVNHEAAMEHEQAYCALADSNLDWTIVCPTRLVQTEFTGEYRVRKNILPTGGSQISFADTAHFAVSSYLNQTFVRERVGICY